MNRKNRNIKFLLKVLIVFTLLFHANLNYGKHTISNNLDAAKGLAFFEDVVATKGVVDKLGGELRNFSEGWVKAWDGLKSSPLRLDVPALGLGSKMLNDGFNASHLKNIAKDCGHDIRGLQIADKFAGRTTIENAQIMARKGFKNGVDNPIEIISNNLDGIYTGNSIDGWKKLKETIDKINTGQINNHSLIRGSDEIASGKQIQIENGKADLEIFSPSPKESYQLKRTDVDTPEKVRTKIEEADGQLGGPTEIPTTGHTKIAEVEVTNTNNSLFNLNESDLLTQLQSLNITIGSAEKVVVQNGVGRFVFNSSQL